MFYIIFKPALRGYHNLAALESIVLTTIFKIMKDGQNQFLVVSPFICVQGFHDRLDSFSRNFVDIVRIKKSNEFCCCIGKVEGRSNPFPHVREEGGLLCVGIW